MVQESVPIAPADAGAALGKAPIRIRETRLCEHFLDHLSGHDRGTLRAAIVKIGEVEVIQSKLIQDRRVNVVDMRRAADGASSRQLRDSSWTTPFPNLQATPEFNPGHHF